MRRSIASALIAGVFCMFGLVGCGEESKTSSTEVKADSGGKTVTTTDTKVKSTGENPPPNSAGETGSTPK